MMQLAATQGRQGMHPYFTATLRIGELEKMVVFPDSPEFKELDEDQRMQRGLARTRLSALVDYLNDSPNHFFSSVTLIIMPRGLEAPAKPYDPANEDDEFDYYFEQGERNGPGRTRHGTLHLPGHVILFPADGQHRLAAAFEALRSNPALGKEELPVVLVPFESFNQVRQLFSDLNLNAKPVSKTTGYDFDTRDPLAMMAKKVADTLPLFHGGAGGSRVNRVSNSLPNSSRNVITLNTLVQGTRSIVNGLASRVNPNLTAEQYLKRTEAPDEVLHAWKTVVDAFRSEWDTLEQGEVTAGELRDAYLFPHGLGWLALASAAGQCIALMGDEDWADMFTQAVHHLAWDRGAPTWRGNAVLEGPDGSLRVNNTSTAVKNVASSVIIALANVE